MAVQLQLFDANCSRLETFSICQGPIHPCRQIYRGGGSDDDEDDDDDDEEEEEEEEEEDTSKFDENYDADDEYMI